MLGVLRGRPLFDDEVTYHMQSEFYAAGHITGADLGFFPGDIFSVRSQITYTGKNLFGEGLVQMAGLPFDRPALLHLPLAALTLFVWYRVVRNAAGPTLAGWATFFLAVAPMFVLTSATGLSQLTALACIVFAGLGYEWARGATRGSARCSWRWRSASGIAARPQSAAPAGFRPGQRDALGARPAP